MQVTIGSASDPVDNLLAIWRPAWHTVVGIIVCDLRTLAIIRIYAHQLRGADLGALKEAANSDKDGITAR